MRASMVVEGACPECATRLVACDVCEENPAWFVCPNSCGAEQREDYLCVPHWRIENNTVIRYVNERTTKWQLRSSESA